jgi:hypothetical protein
MSDQTRYINEGRRNTTISDVLTHVEQDNFVRIPLGSSARNRSQHHLQSAHRLENRRVSLFLSCNSFLNHLDCKRSRNYNAATNSYCLFVQSAQLTLLVLDLSLDVLNGVAWLDLKGDGLAR